MPESNLEVTKRYVALWEAGDFSAVMDDVADDVTVDWSESHAPYGGIYQGHAGWLKLFSELRTLFGAAHVEVHEYVVAGPHVAVRNTSHLRGRGDIEVTATSTMVLSFGDDGKVAAIKLFQEHADALKAIGAEPTRASRR